MNEQMGTRSTACKAPQLGPNGVAGGDGVCCVTRKPAAREVAALIIEPDTPKAFVESDETTYAHLEKEASIQSE